MRTKTAKRILSETPQEVKDRAEKWAEEVLNNVTIDSDEFLELAILGTLLYKVDENGNKTRIKRM